MGMLKLPTLFSVKVVYICGKYCMDARTVAKIPRKLAHPCRFCGRAKMKQQERMTMMMACRMLSPVTTSAVRRVGALWSFKPSGVVGVARGKKTRKRSRLGEYQHCAYGKHWRCIHYGEAAPLHSDLQHPKQACEARKAINLMAACDVFATCG